MAAPEFETIESSVIFVDERNFEEDVYTDSLWGGLLLNDDEATSIPDNGGDQNQSLIDHNECSKEGPLKRNIVQKPFRCDYCPMAFDRESQRRHHVRAHTPPGGYKCEICSRTFRRFSTLARHMPMHSGDKSFECDLCGKRFPFRNEVRRHMRTHTGERPYKCTECPKVFANSGSLKVHSRLHTGEMPFQCCRCGMCFPTSLKIRKHLSEWCCR